MKITVIAFIAVSALAVLFAVYVIAKIVGTVRTWTTGLLGGLTLSDLRKAIADGKAEAENPSERTLFGATSIYLPKILQDFPDFHLPEAKAALNVLLDEYLRIRYGESSKFSKSTVEPDMVSAVPKLAADASGAIHVSNVNFHDAAISRYVKTNEYATITYVATVGYTAGDKRREERYFIDSTLKLRENGIEKKLLVCSRCGGTIDSTSEKVCPYCGCGIIWDTRKSWRFTQIKAG